MVNKLNYAHNILCLKNNQPSFYKTVKNYLKHKWALTGAKERIKLTIIFITLCSLSPGQSQHSSPTSRITGGCPRDKPAWGGTDFSNTQNDSIFHSRCY